MLTNHLVDRSTDFNKFLVIERPANDLYSTWLIDEKFRVVCGI
jgi:hypothetical protein